MVWVGFEIRYEVTTVRKGSILPRNRVASFMVESLSGRLQAVRHCRAPEASVETNISSAMSASRASTRLSMATAAAVSIHDSLRIRCTLQIQLYSAYRQPRNI